MASGDTTIFARPGSAWTRENIYNSTNGMQTYLDAATAYLSIAARSTDRRFAQEASHRNFANRAADQGPFLGAGCNLDRYRRYFAVEIARHKRSCASSNRRKRTLARSARLNIARITGNRPGVLACSNACCASNTHSGKRRTSRASRRGEQSETYGVAAGRGRGRLRRGSQTGRRDAIRSI